jgi:glycosyltransferase involved in cell wall biosynthesis
MRSLRIAHCESSINMGGQELRILDLIEQQNAHGHHVMLLARSESAIFQEAKARRLRVHHVDFRNSFNIAGLSALAYRTIRHSIDILDCHSFRDAALSIWMKALGCRLVWSIFTSKFYKRDPAHKLQWRLGPHATIAASEHIKQTLIEAYALDPKSVSVIGEAVDLNRYMLSSTLIEEGKAIRKRWNISETAPLIIQVAMIRPDKQQILAAQAMEIIWQYLPDAFLLFVGEATQPRFREELEKRLQSASRRDQIRITGFEPDPRPYYAAANIVALASQAEARSRVIAEAQAMGCLVVAPKIGGIPEVIQDGKNGFLYQGGSMADLAQKVLEVHALDMEKKMAVQSAARKWATLHASLEAQYQATLEVYHKALKV